MTEFNTILNKTSYSMIDVECDRNCRGKLYSFAWAKLNTPECKSIKRKIDRLAKKNGLKTSKFSVYGTSSDYAAMQELRIRIMDEMNLFVSPVTWVPTEEYGLDFFIFGYFPLFERKEFEYVENAGYLDKHFNTAPVTIENLFRLESMRMNTVCEKPYQAPYMADFGLDDSGPSLWCKIRQKEYRDFYELADDSMYSEELSPVEFADTVIRDFGMEDEHVRELKLIVSRKPDKAAKLYTMLSSRLNTSWIINVNMHDRTNCAVTFSYDDSRYDRTSKHHTLFYIQNDLVWNI